MVMIFLLKLIVKSIWRDIICKVLHREMWTRVLVNRKFSNHTHNHHRCCQKFSNENRQIDGDFRNICHSNHFFLLLLLLLQAQTWISDRILSYFWYSYQRTEFPFCFCEQNKNHGRANLLTVFFTLYVLLHTYNSKFYLYIYGKLDVVCTTMQ